jgi:hypothetical protein
MQVELIYAYAYVTGVCICVKPYGDLPRCVLSCCRSFWSFLNSYATLFSLIFEGGLYPVMFMDYVGELLGK